MFSESGKELKKIRVMTFCAMFAALAVILEYVTSIEIGSYIKIGFSGIPNQLVDTLFGPITGALFAGALDIIKYIVKPSGSFFFGFTFDAMLAAFIYGCFYYKKPLNFWRVLIAKGLVVFIVNIFFNTFWLSIVYGQGFMLLLPARVVKNLIMWPVDSIVFFVIVKALEHTGVFKDFIVKKSNK